VLFAGDASPCQAAPARAFIHPDGRNIANNTRKTSVFFIARLLKWIWGSD